MNSDSGNGDEQEKLRQFVESVMQVTVESLVRISALEKVLLEKEVFGQDELKQVTEQLSGELLSSLLHRMQDVKESEE